MENPIEKETQLSSVNTYGYFVLSIFHNLANQLTQFQCELLDCQHLLPTKNFNELQTQLSYLYQIVKHSQDVIYRCDPQPEWFDVTSMFIQIKKLLSLAFTRHKAQLRLDIPSECLFFGDVVILQQIIMNLIWNSLEAIKKQPVNRSYVTIKIKIQPQYLIIKIVDTGPKLNESILKRFQDLKKLSPSQIDATAIQPSDKPHSHGLGLLYVYKHVATSFQGEIDFENNQQGTTCCLKLPRKYVEDLADIDKI